MPQYLVNLAEIRGDQLFPDATTPKAEEGGGI